MKPVLLLDSSYYPVNVISWRKALLLSILDKADVLEESGEIVRSPSTSLIVPSVIRLRNCKVKYKTTVKFNKTNIFIRDRGRCQYCNNTVTLNSMTFDHVVPVVRGGRTTWTNIVTACSKCNCRKGSKTIEEAGMIIRKYPEKPKNVPVIVFKLQAIGNVPEVWAPYINSFIKYLSNDWS